MKTTYLCLVLTILGGNAWAQVGDLYDADITQKTTITNPAAAMKSAEGQWLAFSLPVLNGTRSPCCWKGKWNGTGEVGCSLELTHQSYGTRSDSPLAENVIVFSEIRGGQVHKLRVVGESCPVEGNGVQVTWIGSVDNTAGLDWLESVAHSEGSGSAGDSALYALALHRSPEAGQRLYSLALNIEDDLFEEAIFWLGEARSDQGSEMLFDLARDAQAPREVRRQALFWLANSDDDKTIAALTALLTH